MAPKSQRCAHCKAYSGEPGGTQKGLMQICSGCRDEVVSYCNQKCQKLGWKDHKGLCQKLRVIASDIENMSLASPLETVCRSQIELYINTYDHVLKMAADSALAVQRPDDISSTHLLVLHLTWNKDAGTRIEEQFSFSRADIETNAWYEARVTGVDRKEEEDAINTPGMKRSVTFGRDVMLEADFIAGRRLDLPDDSPTILTRILVVVRPTVVGNERIPPIIRRVFHKSDVAFNHGRPSFLTPPVDQRWLEHLRQDLAHRPLSFTEYAAISFSRHRVNPESPEGQAQLRMMESLPAASANVKAMIQAMKNSEIRDQNAAKEKAARKAKKNSQRD